MGNKKALYEEKMSPEQIAQDAEKWVSSTAGQRILEETLKKINETVTQLSNERFVDSQTLRMPLSI